MPYAEAIHLALVPDGFVSFHKLSHDHAYSAAILIRSDYSDLLCLDEVSCNHTEKATLTLSNFKLTLISSYMRPLTPVPRTFLTSALSQLNTNKDIIAIDSNAHNTVWNSARTDEWGTIVEDSLLEHKFHLLNKLKDELTFVPRGTSFVDITATKGDVEIDNWQFLEKPSLSDHPYIYFKLVVPTSVANRQSMKTQCPPLPRQLEVTKFRSDLRESLQLELSGNAVILGILGRLNVARSLVF